MEIKNSKKIKSAERIRSEKRKESNIINSDLLSSSSDSITIPIPISPLLNSENINLENNNNKLLIQSTTTKSTPFKISKSDLTQTNQNCIKKEATEIPSINSAFRKVLTHDEHLKIWVCIIF